jgi:hypothetical protein
MILRLTLAILKTTLVLASVVLLDDIMHDKLPTNLASLMPAWVWLLPTERIIA